MYLHTSASELKVGERRWCDGGGDVVMVPMISDGGSGDGDAEEVC